MTGERVLPGGAAIEGYWTPATGGWNVKMDENLRKIAVGMASRLVALSQTTVLPVSPTNGDIYIVKDGEVNEKKIALRDNGAWVYYDAYEGLKAWVLDTDIDMQFDGTNWVESAAGTLPGAYLTKSADQSISSSTFTTILWDTAAYDDLGNYDLGASDGQVDILEDGRYDLEFEWETTTRTGSWHVYITKNGTDNTAAIAYMSQNSSSSIIGSGSLVKLGIPLQAGDIIRAVIWCSGATTFTAARANLTVRKVG